ncbi:unnamed protein product [Soboliphyme baturini]|uniref:Tnp_DDE_dom domain-containing protein n=1 Tax=Soboliphyme baturini TaxID=241478 RepID=A0A183IZU6_9BILA|nr:unnamed protein product [Soboliphyme baturini]
MAVNLSGQAAHGPQMAAIGGSEIDLSKQWPIIQATLANKRPEKRIIRLRLPTAPAEIAPRPVRLVLFDCASTTSHRSHRSRTPRRSSSKTSLSHV